MMKSDLIAIYNTLHKRVNDRKHELEQMERSRTITGRFLPGCGGQFKNVEQAINYIRDKENELFALEQRMRMHQYDYMDRYPENHPIYAQLAAEIADRHGVLVDLQASKEKWKVSIVYDVDNVETRREVLHSWLTLGEAMQLGEKVAIGMGLKSSVSPLGWITCMGADEGEEDVRVLVEKSEDV